MKFSVLLPAAVIALFVGAVAAGELPFQGLSLVYAASHTVCKDAAAMLRDDVSCRAYDDPGCEYPDAVRVNGTNVRTIEEIATNEYGYTQVGLSTSAHLAKSEVIYLDRFQGDRRPSLLETWKVSADDLKNVLASRPFPLPYKAWVKQTVAPPRDTNSKEFAAILARGEHISDEWSPVISILGNSYAIVRECTGRWEFGGLYRCGRVIKLTIVRLDDERKLRPYCQFASRKLKWLEWPLS